MTKGRIALILAGVATIVGCAALAQSQVPMPDIGTLLYFNQGKVAYLKIGTGFVLSGDDTGVTMISTTSLVDHMERFPLNAHQDAFTLSVDPVGEPDVFKNGILMAPGAAWDYRIAGRTVTFNHPQACALPGDIVQIRYKGGM